MVPARGAANGLEHTVHTLEQLRCDHGGFGAIVIVDCGLSPVGREVAALLSREALENLKLARQTLRGKILGGIYPVVSHKNACFLNNEIAGMRICEEITALYEGRDREEAEAVAVAVSARIAGEIAPYTDGLYLMTPFKRVALMERILREIGAARI